jgi:rhodanese-related sulfurtransferase
MFYTILNAFLLTTPLAIASLPPTASASTQQSHNTISTEELKAWYDQKRPMVVIDARSKEYFNGTMLPNAKWLACESSEKEILTALPNKDILIVVYCAGVRCPASKRLYDKLHAMGYRNVYEYREGIREWMQRGYPTTKQQ